MSMDSPLGSRGDVSRATVIQANDMRYERRLDFV